MARKKILFLPSWYPSRVNPSNGNFIRRYAEAVSSFADVNVLYAVSDANAKGVEVIQSENEGLKENIICYPKLSSPLLPGLLKVRKYLKMFSFGFKKIYAENEKPDLVHVQVTFPAGLFALWLKKKKGIPYVVTEHWTGYYPEDGRYKGLFMNYFSRKIIRNASSVTTVSSSLMNEMKSHGLENEYTVIPNVVDTAVFKPAEIAPPKEKKQFLHISNLDHQKNFEGILNALFNLSKRRKDFQLQVVSDGTSVKKYTELVNKRGLNEIVFFAGKKETSELSTLISQSTCLVMFSRFETMSIVMAEAWACGKPVITSRVGGVTEYMNESRGRLVESGNEKQLERTIDWMLDHSAQFDVEKIRQYAVETFSLQKIQLQFEKVYDKILSK